MSEVPEGLREAAETWNRYAAIYGNQAVRISALDGLVKKYESLERTMARDYPGWSLSKAIESAGVKMPKIWTKSWWRFREFFFRHNFLEKNERLWTGYYSSMYSSHERRDGRGPVDLSEFNQFH